MAVTTTQVEKLIGSSQSAGSVQPLHVLAVDASGSVITSSAVTEADGANVVLGTTTDAAVTGDNSGTIKGTLRYIAKAIASFWDSVNNRIKVNVENATLAVTSTDGAQATLGTTTGAKVITDATGTLQQYLRGLVTLAITARTFIFTKTVQTALLAVQSVALSSVVISSVYTLGGALGGMVYVRFGRRNVTAAGAGVNIRIETSTTATGPWFPLAIFTTAFAATQSQPVTTQAAAGQNVILMTATTNLVVGDVVYIDNVTIGNSEWHRIKSVSANVSITLEDNLVNIQQTTAVVFRAAEIYGPVVIPEAAMFFRVVDDGSLFTQAHAINVLFNTLDNISG